MAFESITELAPAIIGSALASIRGDKKSRLERIVGFLGGFCIAAFMTAPVIDYFHLTAGTYNGGVGFALGYFGMALADGVLSSDWADIIKSRLGGGS